MEAKKREYWVQHGNAQHSCRPKKYKIHILHNFSSLLLPYQSLLYYIICSRRLGGWQPGFYLYIYKAFSSFISHSQQLNQVYLEYKNTSYIHKHTHWEWKWSRENISRHGSTSATRRVGKSYLLKQTVRDAAAHVNGVCGLLYAKTRQYQRTFQRVTW